ncbi:MAG: carbohydrate kinase family protein [Anaerolineae bacterium]|nr:carbohydrate kinase family protein [Anaerolineae bacterium]
MKAIVAGHLCLDIIPGLSSVDGQQFFSLFQPGRLLQVDTASISTGGAASNTGLALSKLGIDTSIIAKVGQDPFGILVKEILEEYHQGIGDDLLIDPAGSTSYTVIINPKGVDRIFLHSPGANDHFTGDELDFGRIANTQLFHFGYPQLMRQMYIENGRNLARMFHEVRDAGVVTSLDVTFPDPSTEMGQVHWETILGNALEYVDIFCPSIEEILFMLFPSQYADLAAKGEVLAQVSAELLMNVSQKLIEFGVQVVLIKLGDQGLFLRTANSINRESNIGKLLTDPARWSNKYIWSPCYRVRVVGTTGAGDAAIAGFLAAILHGKEPEEAVNIAAAVGACNVEQADALSGVRDWDSTLGRIRSGWMKNDVSHLLNNDWDWIEESQVWRKSVG